MPIDLISPIEGIARTKKVLSADKPKPMTEYQKEKIAVAKESNKLKETNLLQKQEQVNVLKSKEQRLSEKEVRLHNTNESLAKRKQLEAEASLIKEKRLLQNSKNRQAAIKARQSLEDKNFSKTETRNKTLTHLNTLKTMGPQPVGFSNVVQGGGQEDE